MGSKWTCVVCCSVMFFCLDIDGIEVNMYCLLLFCHVLLFRYWLDQCEHGISQEFIVLLSCSFVYILMGSKWTSVVLCCCSVMFFCIDIDGIEVNMCCLMLLFCHVLLFRYWWDRSENVVVLCCCSVMFLFRHWRDRFKHVLSYVVVLSCSFV